MNSETLELIIKAGGDQAIAELKKIHEQLGTLATKADLGGRSLGALRDVLRGVAMGLGIQAWNDVAAVIGRMVDAIPQLIEKGIAWGEQVHQLGILTGASAEQSSRFLGTLTFLGISTEDLGRRVGQLSKNIYTHVALLRELGVVDNATQLSQMNQITLLDRLRSSLQNVASPTQRLAIEMQLLGRGGSALAEYFALTNTQASALAAEMDKLGVTMDENGVIKAEQTSKEFNLLGLAAQGVANRLLNDVAPAVLSAVDAIAGWVEKNGAAIAAFAAQVVNFVLGMISALTGATFSTVTFTSSLGALSDAAGGAADMTDTLTNATKGQTKAIDQEITSVKALESAQATQFERAMKGLAASLDAELKNMDAADKARKLGEDRARLARDLANAEAALVVAQRGGNLDQIVAARQRVSDIVTQQRDLEITTAEDTRRAQIAGVKAYVDAIAQAEKDATNRAALAAQLRKDATSLNSQIAAAKESGDAQKVSDLKIELSAVTEATKRNQQAKTNADLLAQLEAQKQAIGGVGSAISNLGPAWNPMIKGTKDLKSAIEPGLTGSLLAAQQAGIAFGNRIRSLFGDVLNVLNLITGATTTLSADLRSLAIPPDAEKAVGLAIAAFGATRGNMKLVAIGLGLAGIGFATGGTDQGTSTAQAAAGGAGVAGLAATLAGGATAFGSGIGMVGGAALGAFQQWLRDNLLGNYTFGPGGVTRTAPGGSGSGATARGLTPRASGGPVSAYGSYLVGENGPEVLRMGSAGGSITPNGGGFFGNLSVKVFIGEREIQGIVSRVLFEEERRHAGPAFAGSGF